MHFIRKNRVCPPPKTKFGTKFVAKSIALPALAALALSACGGGGGGSSNTPSGPTNQAPNASFTMTPNSGAAPLEITVDASSSSDPDNAISGYSWRFGDNGTPIIGETAQHTYIDQGSFTITLTVTDAAGATATATRSVDVAASLGTATISGTIQILNSSAIDSDVNDRLTGIQANNNFANAQSIGNPATLGGFINRANTGEATGNLFTTGDPADFYRINLAGDEAILLTISESTADLDLRLWSDTTPPVLVDASVSAEPTETMTVNVPGDYFIEVVPISGASNYVLNVGQNTSTAGLQLQQSAKNISADFVPGELIVKTKIQSNVQSSQSTTALNHARARYEKATDMLSAADALMLLKTKPSADASNSSKVIANTQPKIAAAELNFPAKADVSEYQRVKYQTLMDAKTLASDPNIDYVEPNLIRQSHQEPNDAFYSRQWHYPAINLPLAWDSTTGANSVIVAVVDTGVLLNHPDIANQVIAGYDFVSDVARANDGNGIDANPDDPGDNALGGSSSFHGTHVSGTVAAQSNNAVGAAGTSWLTRIMPMRALGVDGGTTADVLQAMRFAAGLSNNSGTVPPQPADIINLSLGGSFASQAEQDVINEIRAAGVIIIASAGNESTDLPSYPASYEGVVSVSATTINNSIAPYSNFGPSTDIAAPGGNNATDLNGDGIGDGVISTIGSDSGGGPIQFGYASLNGTSMAAPHVAGVAALMKAVHPGLTPQQFDSALVAGDLTEDLGAPGRDDRYGYGLVNAQKAVIAALALANGSGTDPGPVLSTNISTFNLGAFGTQQTFTLSNVGTGTIAISSITPDQPWLTVVADTTDANGLGTYNVNVNRTGLADGAYSAEIIVDSDSNDLILTALMQVSSVLPGADAGLHYVILVDGEGNSVLPAEVIPVSGGQYSFTISDVPLGQYQLFAGSDSDDDNFLCDAGEACGSYRTIDSPDTLSVNGDLTDLDFLSSFRATISTLSAQDNADNSSQLNAGATGIAFDKKSQKSLN